MKYLAILKDSLREALDSTVLYVMLGLSTLVILFVATLSFKPLAAEKTLSKVVDGTFSFLPEALKEKSVGSALAKKIFRQAGLLTLKKVELVSGESDSPDSTYRLSLDLRVGGKEEAAALKHNPAHAADEIRQQLASATERNFIAINDIQMAPSEEQEKERSHVLFYVTVGPAAATRRIWFSEPSLFFGAVPLGDITLPTGFQLWFLADMVVGFGSWVAIIAGVIITSFFIPNMLRKGSVELMLVKPIHRWALLLYKYIGGLTFIFINNVYAITGIWLVLGLRSGIWANWSLLIIFVLTFFFAILYSISTLMAVLTRSSVTAILVTIGLWFLFFLVGFAHHSFDHQMREEEARNIPTEERRWTNNAFAKTVAAVYIVLPRTSDLSQLTTMLIVSDFMTGSGSEARELAGFNINWRESLAVSGGFIAVLLILACWRFSRQDF